MSVEKRKYAENTEYHLKRAEEHIGAAEQSSQGTGDRDLTKKVIKVKEAVSETRKELTKKLGGD